MAKDKVEKDKEEKKDKEDKEAKLDAIEAFARKEEKEKEKRRKPGEVFFGRRSDRRKKVGIVRRAAKTVETEKL